VRSVGVIRHGAAASPGRPAAPERSTAAGGPPFAGSPSLRRAAGEAVAAAARALVQAQDGDGFWREYALPPGPAEGWTTAMVGFLLSAAGVPKETERSLRRARAAIVSASRPGGWGYNRRTEMDADTTAWCALFLADSIGPGSRARLRRLLAAYLDEEGRAHTFRTSAAGAWGGPQADVTPLVGLALVALGAPLAELRPVRSAVEADQWADGSWPSFWWRTDLYATAFSLRFLEASGGLPLPIARRLGGFLERRPPADCFEAALLLDAQLGLGGTAVTAATIEGLIEGLGAGLAAPTSWMQVPARFSGEAGAAPEIKGLLTTSLAMSALAAWLRLARSDPGAIPGRGPAAGGEPPSRFAP
jgi:hypothetical protein